MIADIIPIQNISLVFQIVADDFFDATLESPTDNACPSE
jgi:hypothetical protein